MTNKHCSRSLRLHFRNIRDASNPFEIAEDKFKKLFRLNKVAATDLITQLQGYVDEPTRRDTVPFHLQVFSSLLFYAHGGYQTTVGHDFNIGISQPVMSRLINKISRLIALHLSPRYIRFPTTSEEVRRVKDGFLENHQFPNVVGVIDCTHIAIVPPKTDDPINPSVAYINRKGFHSVNVQAIFDSHLMITNVNAKYPGAVHDAAIFDSSNIQRHLKQKYEDGRRNCYLLGDSGYPLQPWLLTPILATRANTPEAHYNSIHINTRNVVERGFGIWKARFRCLRKDRVLHYSHDTSGMIIYACAVLHNICRIYNAEQEYEDNGDSHDNTDQTTDSSHPDDAAIPSNDFLTEGRFIRQQLVNQLSTAIR
ncbi:unnamed protein product [Acanthoscelides obtectus]|uniref:DDE Tnp4 domain-containing protein n=1 Tax=Acanthoscelides obtectus TaxID=200917 RepID=A0A9P0LFW4_ACAOB|nr:unnamed protein product [Acanthoscelides obtectus]CAK1634091.1 Putative nuclease HARBI1 [Acanthoscelides obtectus]